jgi:hypothetical protein
LKRLKKPQHWVPDPACCIVVAGGSLGARAHRVRQGYYKTKYKRKAWILSRENFSHRGVNSSRKVSRETFRRSPVFDLIDQALAKSSLKGFVAFFLIERLKIIRYV